MRLIFPLLLLLAPAALPAKPPPPPPAVPNGPVPEPDGRALPLRPTNRGQCRNLVRRRRPRRRRRLDARRSCARMRRASSPCSTATATASSKWSRSPATRMRSRPRSRSACRCEAPASANGAGSRQRRVLVYEKGLDGAGRFSFLNIPHPVMAADVDMNRGVSRGEFAQAADERFAFARQGSRRPPRPGRAAALAAAAQPAAAPRRPARLQARGHLPALEPVPMTLKLPLPGEGGAQRHGARTVSGLRREAIQPRQDSL